MNNMMGFNPMGQVPGQAALPFRCDMPMTPTVPGTPDNPTSYPSINVNPQMMQYAKTVIGYCMHEVQINAGKNPLRMFAYNCLSNNGWTNQEFAGLVTFAADLALFMVMGQNLDVRSAIVTAANQVSTWYTSVIAAKFMQYGLPVTQDMMPELQTNIGAYETAMRTVNDFKNRLQWQQSQQGMQWNNQQQQPMAFNPGFGVPGMQAPTSAPSAGVQFTGSSTGMFSSGPAASPPANSELSIGMIPSMGSFRKENAEVHEITFAPQSEPAIVTHNDVVGEVVVSSKTASDVKTKYRNLVLASRNVGVERNWSIDRTHALAYDPNKHVLFIERDASEIRGVEVLKTIDEVGMDYIDHELENNFKLKAFNDQLSPRRTVQPNWNALTSAKTLEEIERQERDISVPINGALLSLEKPIACSLEQATQLVKMRLNDKKIKLGKNSTFAFSYRNVTPFYVDESYGTTLIDLKESFLKLNDYIEVRTMLDNNINEIPVDIWHYINQRFTDAVNKELNIGLGIKTFIDGFHEDINDLMRTSLSKRGEGVLKAFCNGQRNVTHNVLRNIKKEGLEEYLKNIHQEYNEDSEARNMVFFEDYLVVMVPWLSSKIDVVFREKSGAIMESFLPEFYNGCKKIVEMGKEAKVQKRIIVTADNVRISVDEPILGTDLFIVSRVN